MNLRNFRELTFSGPCFSLISISESKMAIGGGMKLQEKEAESDDSNMMKIQRFYSFVVMIHYALFV